MCVVCARVFGSCFIFIWGNLFHSGGTSHVYKSVKQAFPMWIFTWASERDREGGMVCACLCVYVCYWYCLCVNLHRVTWYVNESIPCWHKYNEQRAFTIGILCVMQIVKKHGACLVTYANGVCVRARVCLGLYGSPVVSFVAGGGWIRCSLFALLWFVWPCNNLFVFIFQAHTHTHSA